MTATDSLVQKQIEHHITFVQLSIEEELALNILISTQTASGPRKHRENYKETN